MIKVQDTGELYMKQINEMIGAETDVARRVRKHRAKENLLQSNADETKCNTEIRDKRLDIRDKRRDRTTHPLL